MTRPLRRAHLWIWLGLSLALPMLIAAAIAARPAQPANPGLRWSQLP
jgi:hypothetical protein